MFSTSVLEDFLYRIKRLDCIHIVRCVNRKSRLISIIKAIFSTRFYCNQNLAAWRNLRHRRYFTRAANFVAVIRDWCDSGCRGNAGELASCHWRHLLLLALLGCAGSRVLASVQRPLSAQEDKDGQSLIGCWTSRQPRFNDVAKVWLPWHLSLLIDLLITYW